MNTFNRNKSGRFTGTRHNTRSLVVGGKKYRKLEEEGLKRGTGKPVVETVKLSDGKTTVTCKPDRVSFWVDRFPKLKKAA
jgi:hypothetical protein